jgi:hypothetical protein
MAEIDPYQVIAARVFDRWKEMNSDAGERKRKEAKDTLDRALMKKIFDVAWESTSYSGLKELSQTLDVVDRQSLTNTTSRDATLKYSKKVDVTDTFTFSFTEGLKAGITTKVLTGIPFIAEGEIQVSVELNFSATQQKTVQKTESTQIEANFVAAPSETLAIEVRQTTLHFELATDFLFGYQVQDKVAWNRTARPLWDRGGDIDKVLNTTDILQLHIAGRVTGVAGKRWDVVAKSGTASRTRTVMR